MRKLKYNDYLNIDDKEFFAIQDRLVILNEKIKKILNSNIWDINTQIATNDGLNINFATKGTSLSGNLAIIFEDRANSISFTMSISKSFDTNNTRYLLRYYVFSDKEFDFFENNIEKFVSEALEKYDSWSKEDIQEFGVTIKLGLQ